MLARQSGNHEGAAQALSNLGVVYVKEDRYAEARKAYEEALTIYRELAKASPNLYLLEKANTLNNLGILDSYERRYAEGRKAFEEALAIYREFAQAPPDAYRSELAATLVNLGNLQKNARRYVHARKAMEESLAIYRSLSRAVLMPIGPHSRRPSITSAMCIGTRSATLMRARPLRRRWRFAASSLRRAPTPIAPLSREP